MTMLTLIRLASLTKTDSFCWIGLEAAVADCTGWAPSLFSHSDINESMATPSSEISAPCPCSIPAPLSLLLKSSSENEKNNVKIII